MENEKRFEGIEKVKGSEKNKGIKPNELSISRGEEFGETKKNLFLRKSAFLFYSYFDLFAFAVIVAPSPFFTFQWPATVARESYTIFVFITRNLNRFG